MTFYLYGTSVSEKIHLFAERCIFLLGQGPVSIVEFFVDPKNGTLETNKPPAMQVSQYCFSLQKKTSSDTIMLVRQPH